MKKNEAFEFLEEAHVFHVTPLAAESVSSFHSKCVYNREENREEATK